MTTDTLQPMDLGEIYGRTFSLIRRTLPLALTVFLIIFGVAVLYGYGNMLYIGVQADIAAKGGLGPNADPEVAQAATKQALGAIIPFIFILIIFLFGLTFSHVAATIGSWEAINNRPAGVGGVLARTIRRPFWMSLLQTLMFAVVMVSIALVIGILAFIASGGKQGNVALIFSLMILVAWAYPLVATSFRVHKTALEWRGPWQGMIASMAMVKGSFWRVFGTLFLLAVALFAIGLLVGVANGSMKMPFGEAGVDPTDTEAVAAALQKAKEAYTWGTVMINAAQIALSFTLFYYILTPLYTDLLIRRGELHPEGYEEGYDEYEEGSDDDGNEPR